MPWLPETPRDVFEFAVSPITFPYTFGYAMAYYTVDDPDLDPPDWQENIRNWGIWSSIVGINWAYHAIMHPGKYEYMSAKGAFHVASKLLPGSIYAATALSAPIVASYAVTSHYAGQMPQHEQSSFWRSVGQALVGTGPGAGSWTP